MSVRMFLDLYRLRRNLRLKPSEMEQMQIKRLREIIWHAYSNVPFYHAKFRSAGIKPDDVKSLDDLHRVPVTSKFELQACGLRDVVAACVDVSSLVKKTTSGSTGVPLFLFMNRRVEDFYGAVWMRAMFEDGLRVRDRMAVITDPRDFPKRKTLFQRFGVAERRYISIFDSPNKQMALLREFRPDVIKGYASSLCILAGEFGELLREVGSRLVFSGAELLDAESRRLIGQAFGGELFDFYACNEFGLLAWECKKHNGYHLNADSILVEFLDDDGETVTFGERGEVVCTSLFNDVMPLIRYKLEDVAVPIDYGCECGVSLPLIKVVEGRADDFLLTTDGRVISPTVFFPYPFEDMDWIKQFRVLQPSINKLVIQISARQLLPNQSLVIRNAEKKIKSLFGEDIKVEFQFVNEISKNSSGKRRKVISHVSGQRRNSQGALSTFV